MRPAAEKEGLLGCGEIFRQSLIKNAFFRWSRPEGKRYMPYAGRSRAKKRMNMDKHLHGQSQFAMR